MEAQWAAFDPATSMSSSPFFLSLFAPPNLPPPLHLPVSSSEQPASTLWAFSDTAEDKFAATSAPFPSGDAAVGGIFLDRARVNEEASEKVLEVEQKYNEIRMPVYARQNDIIKSIPDFWLTAFMSHLTLAEMLSEEDHMHVSLPFGTLAATLTTSLLYFIFVLVFGELAIREELLTYRQVIPRCCGLVYFCKCIYRYYTFHSRCRTSFGYCFINWKMVDLIYLSYYNIESLGEAGKVDEAEALMKKVEVLNMDKTILNQPTTTAEKALILTLEAKEKQEKMQD